MELNKLNKNGKQKQKKYYKKMKKIIPTTEAAKFIQAINKIDDLVNAKLALEIPLISSN